jgi:hypothetical protein
MRSVPPVVFVSLLGLAACAPAGSSAFVSANVPLSGDCTPLEGTQVISTGMYDVLSSGTKKENCVRPYTMSLLVNSNLKNNSNVSLGRAEPNTLLIKYADVRLMDKDEGTLGFKDKNSNDDATRPNPYRVRTAVSIDPSDGDNPTTGFVTLDAIPSVYASALRMFSGDSILVEVQLFGNTTGDVKIDFDPFVLPLAICIDCLSTCAGDSKWTADPAALTELNSGECNDKRPQDKRWCVDPDC